MPTLDSDYEFSDLTGSDYCYGYRQLRLDASQAQIKSYCDVSRLKFTAIAKTFSDSQNSTWILRHYLAMKFAMSAAILSGSGLYSRDNNVLMAVPYFNYYALLSACRALILTSPDMVWEGEKSVKMTHQKILNVAGDALARLDNGRASAWKQKLKNAREYRELFSYQFPATGLDLAKSIAVDPEEAADFARLILELAMLNSECFEASLSKHAKPYYSVPVLSDHDWATTYEIAGVPEIDFDDLRRFGKFVSGWRRVSTLEVMASDGLVEDFYGSWHDGEDSDHAFDPDDYMYHLISL